MFADTDFLFALVKESDWLKQHASKLLKDYKGRLTSSVSVMIELALLCDRTKRPVLPTFVNILEIVNVDESTHSVCLRAALFIDKYGLNTFDAFHAAYCNGDTIISSDSVYEKVGLKRIKLEN